MRSGSEAAGDDDDDDEDEDDADDDDAEDDDDDKDDDDADDEEFDVDSKSCLVGIAASTNAFACAATAAGTNAQPDVAVTLPVAGVKSATGGDEPTCIASGETASKGDRSGGDNGKGNGKGSGCGDGRARACRCT